MPPSVHKKVQTPCCSKSPLMNLPGTQAKVNAQSSSLQCSLFIIANIGKCFKIANYWKQIYAFRTTPFPLPVSFLATLKNWVTLTKSPNKTKPSSEAIFSRVRPVNYICVKGPSVGSHTHHVSPQCFKIAMASIILPPLYSTLPERQGCVFPTEFTYSLAPKEWSR